MAVLTRVALVAACALASACYAPDAIDCTVTCSSPSDCVNGQVCGTDHFCVSREVSGQCSPTDARREVPVELQIQIQGMGMVTLTGGGTCAGGAGPPCFVTAELGVPATLQAVPGPGQQFDQWADQSCQGQPATCTFTPVAAAVLQARFKKAN